MGGRMIGPIMHFKEGRRQLSKRIKNDNPKNKDEPTDCTHFAAHSALRHF